MVKRLQECLEKEVIRLKEGAERVCICTEGGPVSLALVKAIIETVEAQAKEIEALKRRVAP